MHTYLAGTARELGCECFRAGGVADHVHLALRLPNTVAAADAVSKLKTSSSMWMKAQGVPHFAWQRGYALFSVDPRRVQPLLAYIDQQATHHATRSFQDELRVLCREFHVSLDERYAWD